MKDSPTKLLKIRNTLCCEFSRRFAAPVPTRGGAAIQSVSRSGPYRGHLARWRGCVPLPPIGPGQDARAPAGGTPTPRRITLVVRSNMKGSPTKLLKVRNTLCCEFSRRFAAPVPTRGGAAIQSVSRPRPYRGHLARWRGGVPLPPIGHGQDAPATAGGTPATALSLFAIRL
jgi:hypothetical protein